MGRPRTGVPPTDRQNGEECPEEGERGAHCRNPREGSRKRVLGCHEQDVAIFLGDLPRRGDRTSERIASHLDRFRRYAIELSIVHPAPINRRNKAAEEGNAERAPELATGFRDAGGHTGLLGWNGTNHRVGGQGENRCKPQREHGVADDGCREGGQLAGTDKN
jgi:hypothetical protein